MSKEGISPFLYTAVRQWQEEYSDPQGTFETKINPIAVYDRDGKIVRATKSFRELAGLTEKDMSKANIFECLNNEDEELMEAARRALGGALIMMQEIVCPLRPKTKLLLSEHTLAAFFPMTYSNLNCREVVCCAVWLLQEVK